jgi:hypothetical protein
MIESLIDIQYRVERIKLYMMKSTLTETTGAGSFV